MAAAYPSSPSVRRWCSGREPAPHARWKSFPTRPTPASRRVARRPVRAVYLRQRCPGRGRHPATSTGRRSGLPASAGRAGYEPRRKSCVRWPLLGLGERIDVRASAAGQRQAASRRLLIVPTPRQSMRSRQPRTLEYRAWVLPWSRAICRPYAARTDGENGPSSRGDPALWPPSSPPHGQPKSASVAPPARCAALLNGPDGARRAYPVPARQVRAARERGPDRIHQSPASLLRDISRG